MAGVRFSRAAVGVAFRAGVAGGCSSGGDDDNGAEPAPTTTAVPDETTTTAAATTTTLSPEEEVLAAYERASAAFSAAGNPPEAEDPELLATHAGPQLERAQSSIRQLAAQGVGAEATYEPNPTSPPVIVGDRATFTDCGTDRTQLVDVASGAPVGDPGETQVHVDVVMERQGGEWRYVDSTRRTDPCSSP